jgi:6,7-dimethyl-8-ribityllumazine synthase
MAAPTILIVWSNYYQDLSEKYLSLCMHALQKYNYPYQVETVAAGTYEIPAVIRHYHQVAPFDAYLPISLLLQGKTDHYAFIWEHVKTCFTQFALEGIIIGNGIIAAPDAKTMQERVENGERAQEAISALDYLLRLKRKLENRS